MPRKKFNKKRRFNRRKRFIKKRGKLSTMRIKTPTVLPDRLFVKLKYTQIGYKVMAGQAQTIVSFRGNSPYDPDAQIGGHSAFGYDQWKSFYTNYRVHKSNIFVRIAYANESMRMAITPSTKVYKPQNISEAYEAPYTKRKTIATTLLTDNYVFNSMYTKKIFGVKSIIDDDFIAETNNTTDLKRNIPNNQWFWTMNFASYDGTTNITAYVDITVTYFVEFLNRVELTRSGILTNAPFGQTGPQDIVFDNEVGVLPTGIGATGSSVGNTGGMEFGEGDNPF